MNDLENQFFEEYKHLDKLCRDIYASDKGVSSYIEQMETSSLSGKALVTGWESDFKHLKRARWLRTVLAHEEGPSECTYDDIGFVKTFRQRIISRTDPLAILYQARKKQRTAAKTTVQNQPEKVAAHYDTVKAEKKKVTSEQHKKSGWNGLWVIILIIIVLLIAGAALILFNRL